MDFKFEQACTTSRFVIISGCSGGGKSTMLAELRRRGYTTVAEPGRRVVEAESRREGRALPWVDMHAFLLQTIELALEDYANAPRNSSQWVFFDRSLVDAAAALQATTGESALETLCQQNRYHMNVFLAPPWPEIFVQDSERRHCLDAALVEFERLTLAYPALGYRISMLPKLNVSSRADFILDALGERR